MDRKLTQSTKGHWKQKQSKKTKTRSGEKSIILCFEIILICYDPHSEENFKRKNITLTYAQSQLINQSIDQSSTHSTNAPPTKKLHQQKTPKPWQNPAKKYFPSRWIAFCFGFNSKAEAKMGKPGSADLHMATLAFIAGWRSRIRGGVRARGGLFHGASATTGWATSSAWGTMSFAAVAFTLAVALKTPFPMSRRSSPSNKRFS